MKAVIIAGGLGTRLRPLTYSTPKAVVPLVNKPFLLYQVELLLEHGITDIILNLHYLSDKVHDVIAELEALGAKISVSLEEDPLGTAGAVKNAEQFFDDEPMFVFNGDVLTDLDLTAMLKFHKKKKSKITIALTPVEDPRAYGLVVLDENGKIQQFTEKPETNQIVANTINAGTYIIDPKMFADVPKGKFSMFERALFPQSLKKGVPMYGFVSDAYWLDCGTPEKYFVAHKAVLHRDLKAKIAGQEKDGVFYGKDVSVDKTARIIGPSAIGDKVKVGAETYIQDIVVLGEGVEVGKNCNLEHVVVWKGTKIGSDAKLKGAIVGANCIVEDNASIGPGVILGDGSVVRKGSVLGGA